LDHILDPLSLRYQTRLDCFRIYGVVFNKFASKILKIFSFFRRRPVEPPDPVVPVEPVEPVVPVVDDSRSQMVIERMLRLLEQTARDQRSRTAIFRERTARLIDEDTPVVPVEPVVPVVDDPRSQMARLCERMARLREQTARDQRSRTTRIREQTARLMSLIDEDTSILPEGDYLKLCRDLLNLHTRLPG
jgi:hypothetical protein